MSVPVGGDASDEADERVRAPSVEVLPDEFFGLRDEVIAAIAVTPIVHRDLFTARFHVGVAHEYFANLANLIGRTIIERSLEMGRVPYYMPVWDRSLLANLAGASRLLRVLDRRCGAAEQLATFDARAFADAQESLQRVNEVEGLLEAFDQVFLGWRTFEINGRHVQLRRTASGTLGKLLALSIQQQVEHNRPLLDRTNADPAQRAHYRELARRSQALGDARIELEYELIRSAAGFMREAGDVLQNWQVPPGLVVANSFSVEEYRRVVDVLRGAAAVHQTIALHAVLTDDRLLMTHDLAEWVDLVVTVARVDPRRARAILDWLTWSAADERQQSDGPTLAKTPLIAVSPSTFALAPNAMLRHGGDAALREIWAGRAPQNYSAILVPLNDELAAAASAIFGGRGWPAATGVEIKEGERVIGDIDSGTGDDETFIVFEAKLFARDMLELAHGRDALVQLDRVVGYLREPAHFARVLGARGFQQAHLVQGVLLVPGRANEQVDLGPTFTVAGLDDVRDAVSVAASPGDAFERLKHRGQHGEVPAEVATLRTFGEWTIEGEGVAVDDLGRVVDQ